MAAFIFALLALAPFIQAAKKLGTFTINKSEISVSGVSSGAAMAVQFQTAYSASVKGLGSIAGVPFSCSGGQFATAMGPCMTSPSEINVTTLVIRTTNLAHSGKIDSTDHLRHSRIFIWAGTSDTVIKTDVSRKMETFYSDFHVSPANIKAVYNSGAEHMFPTENYGNPCSSQGSPYLGKCSYNGAFELLNFIHGNLQKPSGSVALNGKFIQYDQTEFIPLSTEKHGMDIKAYAYIPSDCYDSTVVCKLHVACHGCLMQREIIGDVFARHAGYNEVGELNNIIILYPQIKSDAISNPLGCWDWWGYAGVDYDTKDGVQMKAIKNMIDRVTGDNP